MNTLKTVLAALALAGGAHAQVTVLRLEIDYMEDSLHSHRPAQAEIDALVQMFGCQGIALIVDIDDAVPHVSTMACASPGIDPFFTCTSSSASFASYKAAYADQGSGWHYVLFGHRYDAGSGTLSSGIAELPGNDVFVADGVVGAVPFWRAATLAHELGHNLGLQHYSPGTSASTRGPYAPNLPSVMSYRYQLGGVKTQLECQELVGSAHLFKDLDFSHGRLPSLDENALDESRGMGMIPVDWSCNGLVGGIVDKEIDAQSDWCLQGGGGGQVADHNEWAAIVDVADHEGVWGDDVPLPYVTCAELPEIHPAAVGSCSGVYPSLISEPCAGGKLVFVDPQSSGLFQLGTGLLPFQSLDTALSSSPDGSVLFLQPGDQVLVANGPLVVDDPVVLAGPGVAVIDPD